MRDVPLQAGSRYRRVRRRVALELDPDLRPQGGLSVTNWMILLGIAVAVGVSVLATEPTLTQGREAVFRALEEVFFAALVVEYVARLWVCVENPAVASRWRYMARPVPLVDLGTIVLLLVTAGWQGGLLFRFARVARLARVAGLGRFSQAVALVSGAVCRRRFELFASAGVGGLLLVVTSAMLYVTEGGVQPQAFGSIPRAMWWSVATLTTVGYGDVYPMTVLGRMCAAVTAVAGIGVIALPTGILAAAISDAIQEARQSRELHAPSPSPGTDPRPDGLHDPPARQ